MTRTTTKRLTDVLGVDKIQVIHLALHELATKFLPQYEGDEGALTKIQHSQVKNLLPRPKAVPFAVVCLKWKALNAMMVGAHSRRYRMVPLS